MAEEQQAPEQQPAAPAQPAAEPAAAPAPLWEEPESDDFALVSDVFGLSFEDDQSSVGTEEGGEAEGKTPASPPAAPADGAQPPVQQPAGQPAAGQPEAPPAPPSPESLELASLRAQLEAANALLAEKPEVPAAGQQEEKPAGPQVIPVQLPPQMVDAIFSEDRAQATQGLNMLLTMVATGLHARASAQLDAYKAEVEQRFAGQTQQQQQQVSQQEAEQAAKAARDAYFAAFPDHNKPLLMPILAQEADQLVKEFPGAPWNEQFNAALGARVNAKLQEAGWGQSAPPVPQRPAAMMPTAPRPAATDSDLDMIAETFSFE